MKDKQYKKHRHRLGEELVHWRSELWLGQWTMHLEHARGGLEQADLPRGTARLMQCTADWRYLEATIECSCPQVADLTPEKRTETLVHELLHCVVYEMREWETGQGLGHEERVVTHLTNVIKHLTGGFSRE